MSSGSLDLQKFLQKSAVHLQRQICVESIKNNWISIPPYKNGLDCSVQKSITNSIDLIHEDNAGLMVSGVVEHLSDESGTLTNVLVNNGAGHNLMNNTFYSTLRPYSITVVLWPVPNSLFITSKSTYLQEITVQLTGHSSGKKSLSSAFKNTTLCVNTYISVRDVND